MSVMWFLTPAKGVIRLKARKTDFSIIRKSLVILFLIAVVIPAAAAPSAEAKSGAIPGGPCSKVGKTLNHKGKKLICKRSGSRLRWAKVSTNGKSPVSTTLPETQGSSNGKKPVSTTLPKTQGSTNGKNPVSTTLPETQNSTKHPYKFTNYFNSKTITWPCDAAITIRVNVEQLSPLMRSVVAGEIEGVVSEINLHARLKFAVDGTTSLIPTEDEMFVLLETTPMTVIFAFAYQGQSDLLQPIAAGQGGAMYSSRTGESLVSSQVGQVLIDINRLKLYGPGTGNRSRYGLFLHEMLHVVGLDHVRDPKSVMNPTGSLGIGTMGPGDIAGVKALGALACGS